MSRRIAIAVGVGLVAGAAGAWVVGHRLLAEPPSDEEQIRSLFQEAAKAVQERRIGDAMEGVSERFQGEGLDKRAVKQILTAEVFRGDWVSINISDQRIALDGDRAQAVVDVVMARSGQGASLSALLPQNAAANRFSFELEREKEGWRIVGATRREVGIGDLVEGAKAGAAPGGSAP